MTGLRPAYSRSQYSRLASTHPAVPLWRRLFWSLVRMALMLIVGLSIYVRLFENKLVFYPETNLSGAPGIPFENVQFTATDGTRLAAWYIPFDGSKRVFLISHGNAGNIGDRAIMGEFIHREFHESVFMYDYRGYGRSEGKPSEAGFYADIAGAFAYLRSRGFDSKSIYLIGRSLGTAVTVDLASREAVAGVILEAPFPSVRVLARRIMLSLPFDYVMKSRFDSLSKLAGIHAPVVVVHGREDPVIPYDLGRAMFDAIPGPKKFFTANGAIHEGPLMSLDPISIRDIRLFLGTL